MKLQHFPSLVDVTPVELEEILSLSREIKAHPERFSKSLDGKTLAMIFQKPSTRTRVSFQAGIYQLGGLGMVFNQTELQLGRGETVADSARVLSRYVDGIMARVFGHDIILDLCKYATVPVINGLSDMFHPCQAVCDFLTIRESFGWDSLKGMNVVYVGDGNNVAHSLALAAAKLGVHFKIATPGGKYEPNADVMAKAREAATKTGAKIEIIRNPREAVKGAQVIYSDVWTSMGQEAENAQRMKDLHDYQINLDLFKLAASDAIFMHCLPAHRGEEVTDEVCDHPRSVIFDQAENRLHTQKAIMYLLMKG